MTDNPSAEKTNKPITKPTIQEKYISFHLASKWLSLIRLKSKRVLLAKNKQGKIQKRSNMRCKIYVGSWDLGKRECIPGPIIDLLCR